VSPTAASAQQHEVHLRFNISANTQRHRQRSSSARHKPSQRNLSIWQLGGGSLSSKSGSIQHQRQPRQHLRSSMRSPSVVHLRVVSMSVQHQACVSAAAAFVIGRTLEALATTAEIDIGDMRHRQQLRLSASCALAATRPPGSQRFQRTPPM
jgi:hypothetical protein